MTLKGIFAQGRTAGLHPWEELFLRSSLGYLSLVAIADKVILHYSNNTFWKYYLEILCKQMYIYLSKELYVSCIAHERPSWICLFYGYVDSRFLMWWLFWSFCLYVWKNANRMTILQKVLDLNMLLLHHDFKTIYLRSLCNHLFPICCLKSNILLMKSESRMSLFCLKKPNFWLDSVRMFVASCQFCRVLWYTASLVPS